MYYAHIPGALKVWNWKSQSCRIESFALSKSIWAQSHAHQKLSILQSQDAHALENSQSYTSKSSHITPNSRSYTSWTLNPVPSPDTFALENSQSHASKNSHTAPNSLSLLHLLSFQSCTWQLSLVCFQKLSRYTTFLLEHLQNSQSYHKQTYVHLKH